ncbi:MAG: peptidylprolyl isomerase, partial [Nitrospirae bacterium]|nr:peptidylprolyl isomerase [Nitrospirota bacterium]
KKDIIIEKLIEKETKVVLTDKELEDYYNKNTEKFHEPESVRIRDIFIKYNMSEVDFRKKAEERAKDVMSKLKAGKDFAEMASLHSDDMSKVNGGDVGYIHKNSFTPEIEEIAFSLKIGQMSGPIATEYGYHIIKVEGKKPSRQVPLVQTKEKLRGELTSSYQAKKKEELIKRLRHNAKIIYY